MLAFSQANSVNSHDHIIAGLKVHVYGLEELEPDVKDVHFVLGIHFRGGHQKSDCIVEVARRLIVRSKKDHKNVVVCTFDLPNHGSRLLDALKNRSWKSGNETHFIDQFSFLYGAVNDARMILDLVPIILFPDNHHRVASYAAYGVSLGGHTVWHLLNDERITTACVMIGCPSYTEMMCERAKESDIQVTDRIIPPKLVELIERVGPNPELIKGKHLAVLSGADDTLVPVRYTDAFLPKLQCAELLKKTYPGVKHETPDYMLEECAEFLYKHF